MVMEGAVMHAHKRIIRLGGAVVMMAGAMATVILVSSPSAGAKEPAPAWTAYILPDAAPPGLGPPGPGPYVTPFDSATKTTGANIALSGPFSPIDVAISPNAKLAYVLTAGSNSVTVIRIATKTITASIALPVGAAPEGIAIAPDAKLAYVVDEEGSVTPIDLATNTTGATISPPSGGYEVEFPQHCDCPRWDDGLHRGRRPRCSIRQHISHRPHHEHRWVGDSPSGGRFLRGHRHLSRWLDGPGGRHPLE